jgi:hypothetical protein
VTRFCEHCNEHSGSMKNGEGGDILGYLCEYQLVRQDYDEWEQLVLL